MRYELPKSMPVGDLRYTNLEAQSAYLATYTKLEVIILGSVGKVADMRIPIVGWRGRYKPGQSYKWEYGRLWWVLAVDKRFHSLKS